MYDPEAVYAVPFLAPEHFFEPFHGRLWALIRDAVHAGRRADPTLLLDRVKTDPALASLGGPRYLGDLVDWAPPLSMVAEYGQALLDLSARRGLIALSSEVGTRAADTAAGTALEVIAEAETALAEIAQSGVSETAWTPAQSVIRAAIEAARSREPGRVDYPTGLHEVDAITGGFTAGEMAVIAGRPGMAKSTAALAVAKANAKAGKGVAFFSLEMSAETLGLRLACDLAYDRSALVYSGMSDNPTFDRARRNDLRPDQWDRLAAAQSQVEGWPLHFDTRPGLTVPQIEASARRAFRDWQRQGIEPGPVIVDHMGIVRPDKARNGNKVVETGDISRGLSELAKRLGVPVLAMVQVNRANEAREDRRPGLADLRWSGAIEEDARLVIFLHRPEYYLRPPEDPSSETAAERTERETKRAAARGKLFWIIAKQNAGPTGQVETFCDIGCGAIRDREGRAL